MNWIKLLQLINEDLKNFLDDDILKSSQLRPNSMNAKTQFLSFNLPIKDNNAQDSEMQSVESEHILEMKKLEGYHN